MKNTQPKKRGAAPVATIAVLAVSALAAIPVTLTTRSQDPIAVMNVPDHGLQHDRVLRRKINVKFRDSSFEQMIESLENATNVTITLDGAVTVPPMTLDLNANLQGGLDVVSSLAGMTWRRTGPRAFEIYPPADPTNLADNSRPNWAPDQPNPSRVATSAREVKRERLMSIQMPPGENYDPALWENSKNFPKVVGTYQLVAHKDEKGNLTFTFVPIPEEEGGGSYALVPVKKGKQEPSKVQKTAPAPGVAIPGKIEMTAPLPGAAAPGRAGAPLPGVTSPGISLPGVASSGKGVTSAPKPGVAVQGKGETIAPLSGTTSPGTGVITAKPGAAVQGQGKVIAPLPGTTSPGKGVTTAPKPGVATQGKNETVPPLPSTTSPGKGVISAPKPGETIPALPGRGGATIAPTTFPGDVQIASPKPTHVISPTEGKPLKAATIYTHAQNKKIPKGVTLILPPDTELPNGKLVLDNVPKKEGTYVIVPKKDSKAKGGVRITFHKTEVVPAKSADSRPIAP